VKGDGRGARRGTVKANFGRRSEGERQRSPEETRKNGEKIYLGNGPQLHRCRGGAERVVWVQGGTSGMASVMHRAKQQTHGNHAEDHSYYNFGGVAAATGTDRAGYWLPSYRPPDARERKG